MVGVRVSVRRLLAVTALSAFALAALLGLVSSASAETSMTCTFEGAAGPISPGPEGIIQDILGPPADLLDTDTGLYHFETRQFQVFFKSISSADCAGTTTKYQADPGPREGFMGNVGIASDGSYANIVCGTGLIESTGPTASVVFKGPDVWLPPVGPVPTLRNMAYNIPLAAGQGQIRVTDADLDNVGALEADDDANLTGTGWVSMVPTQPEPSTNPVRMPCVTDRATAFEVGGFFTIQGGS